MSDWIKETFQRNKEFMDAHPELRSAAMLPHITEHVPDEGLWSMFLTELRKTVKHE